MSKPARKFWDKEYQTSKHLALSSEASEDLEKFGRWLARRSEKQKYAQSTGTLDKRSFVADFGCGNGRNLIYLSKTFGVRGVGYDISREAILQAEKAAKDLPLTFEVRSLVDTFPALETESVDCALDMMASHVLSNAEREVFTSELVRILRPGGWLFMKTFLADEDLHVKRLLKENPGPEEWTYIHPTLGVPEHVWTEALLKEYLEEHFIIHKIEKSHKHISEPGKPWKRRSIVAYCERI